MSKITYDTKVALNVNPNVDDVNKVNAADMNEIKNVVNANETKFLLAVVDTAPAECSTGDMYFNTTTNLIYTATGTNTWGATGVAPTNSTLYVVLDTKSTYIYNGSTLVPIGGGGSSDVIMVYPDEATEDTKLLIEEDDLDFQGGEITNAYSESTGIGYSCAYSNWKYAGYTTANNYIQIPENAKEIFIITEESSSQQYTKYMLVDALKTNHYMYNGYYLSNDNWAGCAWQYKSGSGIKVAGLTRAGTMYISSSTTYLYYR